MARMLNMMQRTMQYMLAREGVYLGAIDGVWGEKSREAMEALFTDPDRAPGRAVKCPENGGMFVPYQTLPSGYIWATLHGQIAVVPFEDRKKNRKFRPDLELEKMMLVLSGKEAVVVRELPTVAVTPTENQAPNAAVPAAEKPNIKPSRGPAKPMAAMAEIVLPAVGVADTALVAPDATA